MNVSHACAPRWTAQAPAAPGLPTGDELADRLLDPRRRAALDRPYVRTGTRVRAVGRQGLLKHEAIGSDERTRHPFRLLVEDAAGSTSSTPTSCSTARGPTATPTRWATAASPPRARPRTRRASTAG
jgi:hypothetical protein